MRPDHHWHDILNAVLIVTVAGMTMALLAVVLFQ